MRAAAKTAVGAGDDILPADEPRVALQTLRYQFGMLHHIGRMGDDAGNENLAGRQLHLFPDGDFMLVARVGAFDQISLLLYLQDDIDDAIEFEIVSVRPMPAA